MSLALQISQGAGIFVSNISLRSDDRLARSFVWVRVGLSEYFGVFEPAKFFFAACLPNVRGWAIVPKYTNSSPTAWHVAPLPKSSYEEQ